MQRLRHPIRSITEPFGKAGLTVAILALVLATTGAAFAAAGLNSKQKKEVTKIAKKFAGKPGTNGTNGTNGEKGPTGNTGPAGAPGESVTLAAAGSCKEGGTKLTVGGVSKEVCNGEKGTKGPPGPEGVCSTANCILPKGAVETGVWGGGPPPSSPIGAGLFFIPISFPVPLAKSLGESQVHVFEGETIPSGCTGTVASGSVTHLGAEEGNLCVYVRADVGGNGYSGGHLAVFLSEEEFGVAGASTDGALLSPSVIEAGEIGFGIWAVAGD
jgi:hypothetical protein